MYLRKLLSDCLNEQIKHDLKTASSAQDARFYSLLACRISSRVQMQAIIQERLQLLLVSSRRVKNGRPDVQHGNALIRAHLEHGTSISLRDVKPAVQGLWRGARRQVGPALERVDGRRRDEQDARLGRVAV
jgi:hypothetical protein